MTQRTMRVEQLSLFGDVVTDYFNRIPYEADFSDYGREVVDSWLKLFKEQRFEELAEVATITHGHNNRYYLDPFKAKIGVEQLASDLLRAENRELFILQLQNAYQRIVS